MQIQVASAYQLIHSQSIFVTIVSHCEGLGKVYIVKERSQGNVNHSRDELQPTSKFEDRNNVWPKLTQLKLSCKKSKILQDPWKKTDTLFLHMQESCMDLAGAR